MKKLLPILLALLCGSAVAQTKQSCCAIDADKLEQPKIGRVLFLWGQRSKFWPENTVLRVRFQDGTKAQQDNAWRRFQKVDALVNLTFLRVVAGESEIRVSFRGQGHWSYLGRDCARIGQRSPTMNLQLTAWDSQAEWDRVAVHEMMHAIGFDHEQAHPTASIPWNREVVYADYARTQGWSRAQVDRQVLNRYDGREFMGSEYDKDSIMQYPLPKSHLLDARFAVGWNTRLSAKDIEMMQRIYPAQKVLPDGVKSAK